MEVARNRRTRWPGGTPGGEEKGCGVEVGENPEVEWLRGRGLVDGWVPGVKTLDHDRKVSDLE